MAKWRGVQLRWSCQFVSAPKSSRCLVTSALEFQATRWNGDSSSVYFTVCSQVHQIRHHGHSTVIIQAASSTVRTTAGIQEYGCHSTETPGAPLSSLPSWGVRANIHLWTVASAACLWSLVHLSQSSPLSSLTRLTCTLMHPETKPFWNSNVPCQKWLVLIFCSLETKLPWELKSREMWHA